MLKTEENVERSKSWRFVKPHCNKRNTFYTSDWTDKHTHSDTQTQLIIGNRNNRTLHIPQRQTGLLWWELTLSQTLQSRFHLFERTERLSFLHLFDWIVGDRIRVSFLFAVVAVHTNAEHRVRDGSLEESVHCSTK